MKFSLALLSMLASANAMTVKLTDDADALVNAIAGGPGVKLSNIKVKGNSACRGFWKLDTTVSATSLIHTGIVVSSGAAEKLVGPNDSPSTSTNFNEPGDGQLSGLVGGAATYDACTIEFDAECTDGKTPMIDFMMQYTFYSDEYNEFAPPSSDQFNDIFGFFVDGKNIAKVPGTNDPVSVNTVNKITNSDYYVNNSKGYAAPNLQADGYTAPFPLHGMGKSSGKTPIKISIADVGDHIYDSWVIIEQDSIQCVKPETSGDPHIVTWGDVMYDFMGACDLVLINNPGFANGLGMDIHVRTKIQTWWSHIDKVAVRLGKDVFEFQAGHEEQWFFINGKPNEKMEEGVIFKTEIGGFVTRVQQKNDKIRKVVINLGNGESIVIKSFNEIARVDINPSVYENFEGAVGLMGAFPKGELLGRDGKTVFSDTDAFGQEWMVSDKEDSLFVAAEGAQFPEQCTMPTQPAPKRRLGEANSIREMALDACANVSDPKWKEACIADVIAMGDIEAAGVYAEDSMGAF